jgi:trehalose synthase
MKRLEDYRGIVEDEVITMIYKKVRPLYGKHILNINSTYIGGGVAEILNSLVPLLDDIGVATGWRILHGTPDFFEVTKKFHNALQGREINLTEKKKRLYEETNSTFASYTHIAHDCVIIHDPQPLALIKFYKKRQPWIWRCHIDLTHPHKDTWEFLKNFIIRYDGVVVSDKKYIKKDLPLTYKIIPPSIDPLSLKNKPLSSKDIDKYVKKVGIPQDKLVLLQVARFDPWKDPEGVVEVFKLVKKKVDCILVYCYNLALDDPEGFSLYSRMLKKTEKLRERGEIIFVRGDNQILVNAIQRRADVVIQKSIREGFCIAVTEAMWKEKAVVASNIGGLPLQIVDGQNGFLLPPHNNEEFAERIIQLLKDKELREKIGKEAKERVRKKFLITRHILDYLDLFREVLIR